MLLQMSGIDSIKQKQNVGLSEIAGGALNWHAFIWLKGCIKETFEYHKSTQRYSYSKICAKQISGKPVLFLACPQISG